MLYIIPVFCFSPEPLQSVHPKRIKGKFKGKLILKDSEEEWLCRRFRAALPWGAASCWLSTEAGAQGCCSAKCGFLWAGGGQEGCQVLQMWVGGHGVTRSNQMRTCMQEHLENWKAADRCGASNIFIELKSGENTRRGLCDLWGICRDLTFFPELKGLSKRDS